jgi:EAL domain-containing protein (putative c-di-GMP-specific phosphodiesterase class I)
MNTRMKARRELEMDLRRALAGEQFELYYQPLVVLETNAVNGFEALLRCNHPMRGLVSPADFIPIAEETGLIVPLGEWVLKAACAEAVNWPEHIKVAVNLSPAQLNCRNLVSMVTQAIGCTEMQGYLFSHARPAHEIRRFFVESPARKAGAA